MKKNLVLLLFTQVSFIICCLVPVSMSDNRLQNTSISNKLCHFTDSDFQDGED